MRMIALMTGAAALALSGTAQAQSYGYGSDYGNSHGYQQTAPRVADNCARVEKDNKAGGAIAGALIGGLLGGAIGNNIDNDNTYRRGYRGYRGNRGYRGYRRNNDNSGQVVAGALLGAVAGGVIGNSVAGNATNCRTYSDQSYQPTRAPTGPGWNQPRAPQQPVYSNTRNDNLYGGPTSYPAPTTTYPARTVTTYPASTTSYPTRTVTTQPAPVYQPAQQQCRDVVQETRLPDGRVVSRTAQACLNNRTGSWELTSVGY